MSRRCGFARASVRSMSPCSSRTRSCSSRTTRCASCIYQTSPVRVAVGCGGCRRNGRHDYHRRRVDFELTDEQREIQALARDFADAEIAPNAAEWDRDHHFPRELVGNLAALGLMGVCVPEELGGAGADFVSYVLVLEELSRADAGVGVTVAVHTSACTLPLLTF